MNTRSMPMLLAAGVLACASHGAVAQNAADGASPPAENVVIFGNAAAFGRVDVLGGAARAVTGPVTGKPYSADAITETVQILADGNRIVNSNRSRFYRDSEGRTRSEQTLSGFGPWSVGSEPITMVSIDDPVAQTSYFLNPSTQTAREVQRYRLNVPAAGVQAAPGGGAGTITATRVPFVRAAPLAPGSGAPVEPPVAITMPPVAYSPVASADALGSEHPEDLGEQVLEGVVARGTRVTRTIPAGAVGNERAIEIVTETWYSDEIAALVSSRTYDPRFGETTYRLVNLVRGEPSPDLFKVPQDYELATDAIAPALSYRVEPGDAPPPVPGTRLERRVFTLRPDGAPPGDD